MPLPTEESRIASTEAEIGRRLPDDLRARLLEDNGGEIEAGGIVWHLHPVFDDSDKRRLRRTATAHVVHETREAREAFEDLLPADAVVVANNGGGDLLLLLPDSDVPCWWEPATGELNAAPTDWSQAAADDVGDG